MTRRAIHVLCGIWIVGATGCDGGSLPVGGTAGSSGNGGEGGGSLSAACVGAGCCATVELRPGSVTVSVVDGQVYDDSVVELVEGSLDLRYWYTSMEVSSTETGVMEGTIQGPTNPSIRAASVQSDGAPAGTLACDQTLELDVRLRTDVTYVEGASPTTCEGVFGPSVTVTVSVACPVCPDDAAEETEPCHHPRSLSCLGTVYGMSGEPLQTGCVCPGIEELRYWRCPIA